MHIGILELSIGAFGKKGLYNVQEIGLGKELGKRGHVVDIYKCVDSCEDPQEKKISDNVTLYLIKAKSIGNNAFFSCKKELDKTLDVLISCSDIQVLTTSVYKWAKRNKIVFLPYVGIAHSTSPSFAKRNFINICARRCYSIFKRTGVLVKTNAVKKELITMGIKNIYIAPVGLDFDLLYKDYKAIDQKELFKELQLSTESKYILMVGRLENDRNPLDVIPVFERLHKQEPKYKLIIIGRGSLKTELKEKFEEKKLDENVIWIDQIQNCEMWKYYRVSNALVSFSRTEIFGMSILEAMFYELPVFVIHAPGPDDIIIDKKTGYLFDEPTDMVPYLVNHINDIEISENEHERIINSFSWSPTADQIELTSHQH